MQPDDFAPVFVITLTIIAVAVSSVLILRGPLGKALARRLEGRAGREDVTGAAMAGISERLAELEQRDARVAELEERLDFAERLLAQRDLERVPRGRDD